MALWCVGDAVGRSQKTIMYWLIGASTESPPQLPTDQQARQPWYLRVTVVKGMGGVVSLRLRKIIVLYLCYGSQ